MALTPDIVDDDDNTVVQLQILSQSQWWQRGQPLPCHSLISMLQQCCWWLRWARDQNAGRRPAVKQCRRCLYQCENWHCSLIQTAALQRWRAEGWCGHSGGCQEERPKIFAIYSHTAFFCGTHSRGHTHTHMYMQTCFEPLLVCKDRGKAGNRLTKKFQNSWGDSLMQVVK